MTEVNSTVSENASFTSVSPEKTGRRKKKCNLLQQISNILTSFSGRNATSLSFTRKKNEITPAIHSLSRVWNINFLSPAKHSPLLVFYRWSCTSNEALRVTQSPEPTTATIFSCATAWLENYQKTLMERVLHQVPLGSGQVPSIWFDQPLINSPFIAVVIRAEWIREVMVYVRGT